MQEGYGIRKMRDGGGHDVDGTNMFSLPLLKGERKKGLRKEEGFYWASILEPLM